MSRRFTLVSFHAHPDDEALITGGTLARVSAEGHRVVLVVATAGEAGLADVAPGRGGLGAHRLEELRASAREIGVSRVEVLGYADSGSDPGSVLTDGRFCDVDVDEAARRLADLLGEERADVLTVYDPAGGYGHPDHVQVHRVGTRAAELAGTPVVLEATIDRTIMRRIGRVLGHLSRIVPMPQLWDFENAYTAREDITHVVDVRAHLDAKRAALRAHASQATGGPRTISILLRLPRPVGAKVLGREWFREQGRTPGAEPLDDVFATLRDRPTSTGVEVGEEPDPLDQVPVA